MYYVSNHLVGIQQYVNRILPFFDLFELRNSFFCEKHPVSSILKFIYSEKATKFCKIFPLLLSTVLTYFDIELTGCFSQKKKNYEVSLFKQINQFFSIFFFSKTILIRGRLQTTLTIFWLFDHLPPCIDMFCLIIVDKNWTFYDFRTTYPPLLVNVVCKQPINNIYSNFCL